MIRFFNQSFQWEPPNLRQLAPAAQEDLKEKWILTLLPSIASPIGKKPSKSIIAGLVKSLSI